MKVTDLANVVFEYLNDYRLVKRGQKCPEYRIGFEYFGHKIAF